MLHLCEIMCRSSYQSVNFPTVQKLRQTISLPPGEIAKSRLGQLGPTDVEKETKRYYVELFLPTPGARSEAMGRKTPLTQRTTCGSGFQLRQFTTSNRNTKPNSTSQALSIAFATRGLNRVDSCQPRSRSTASEFNLLTISEAVEGGAGVCVQRYPKQIVPGHTTEFGGFGFLAIGIS